MGFTLDRRHERLIAEILRASCWPDGQTASPGEKRAAILRHAAWSNLHLDGFDRMVCNAAANVIETGNVLNVENVTTMLAETGGLGSDYAIETAKARLKKLVRLCELGIGEHYPRITHGGWGQERLRAAGCEQIGEMFERVYKESPDALMAAIEKGHREGFSD